MDTFTVYRSCMKKLHQSPEKFIRDNANFPKQNKISKRSVMKIVFQRIQCLIDK